ncbi:hypothetical protein WJX77_005777 [Trebouxia sp. C0004]
MCLYNMSSVQEGPTWGVMRAPGSCRASTVCDGRICASSSSSSAKESRLPSAKPLGLMTGESPKEVSYKSNIKKIAEKSMLVMAVTAFNKRSSPMADTMANTQKCILVVAMAIFNKLYGTIGERRSNSSSFQPSLSIAASSMSHFFHFALTIDTMTSRNKYLQLWAGS